MQTYIVSKGDSLWLIAKKFGVTLEELIRANPQIKDPNKIYPGNKINIPLQSHGGARYYVVQPGDTMWLIAKKFGISLDALLRANPQVTDADKIDIGQKIFIPQGGGGNVNGGGSTGTYTVKSGDTMWLIAKKFGISLNELIKLNPQIKDPNMIYPGQRINVPKYSTIMPPQPPSPPTPPMPSPTGENNGRLYFVKSGDTFFNIAQRYALNLDTLIRSNPQITNPDAITPGMQLYLPGSHYVRSGETLFSIAKNYGVELKQLIAVNPQIQNPDIIDVGQKIAIPRRSNGDMAIYTVKQGDSLYKIAQKYNLTVESILNVNPAVENADMIFPGEKLRIPGPHQVQKGQTLTEIASIYGISVNSLIEANPQIENPDLIYPQTMVIIPTKSQCREDRGCPMGVTYVVQPGDTLYEIAKLYHISLENLILANPQIENPDLIYPGQKIRIPVGFAECTCYVVKHGDTLYKIAKMFGVRVNTIIDSNPQIENPNYIEPGWVLMIPLKGTKCHRDENYEDEALAVEMDMEVDMEMDIDIDEERGATGHPIIYDVQKGDTLYSIARKYKVTVKQLLMANPGVVDENLIFPGDQLIILPADMVCEYRCLDCPWFLKSR
ncbi:MAG: SafA/ExsA family spore coat assembly protein [Clostridiales bacterium]